MSLFLIKLILRLTSIGKVESIKYALSDFLTDEIYRRKYRIENASYLYSEAYRKLAGASTPEEVKKEFSMLLHRNSPESIRLASYIKRKEIIGK